MTQALHWDRGRSGVPSGAAPLGCHIARTSVVRHSDLATDLPVGMLFALGSHGGRDVRGPSESLSGLS